MIVHVTAMKTIIALFLLAIAATNAKLFPNDGRIIGGHDTTIETYPYQLSLCYITTHICGASLLNKNYAITAAHCTNGRTAPTLLLRAGSTKKNDGGTFLHITTIFQHPGFTMTTVDNDVSVLKLFMPVEFTPSIQPIKLPENPNFNVDHKTAVCTGWGRMTPEGNSASILQAVDLEVYSDKECKDIYQDRVTEHMLCAGDMTGEKDACAGDSGGPLVVDGVLIGLVSWGLGCANPGHPGIYTKVTSELEFIQQSMNA